MKTRTLVATLVVTAGTFGVAGPAWAQQVQEQQQQQERQFPNAPPAAGASADQQEGTAGARQPGGAMALMTTGTATVKSVDKENRTVTLETPEGKTATFKCGKNVVNFDQIKEGDRVRAAAIESMAVSVGKGGAPEDVQEGMVALAPKGGRPGFIITDTDVMRAKIESVDAQARTVTLKGEQGKEKTIKVGQNIDLNNVKAGDDVTLRLTKGLALIDMKGPGEAQAAGAQLRPGEGAGEVDAMTASATVESVDPADRTVTLKNEQGETRTIHLGKEVRNFDQIQPGDKVRATLAEETVVAVSKGGEAPGAAEGLVMARAPEGAKPGMFLAETTSMTGKIDSVDPDKHMLTITTPDGKQKELRVSRRVDLSQLKSGDDINAKVTQALGIIVEKP